MGRRPPNNGRQRIDGPSMAAGSRNIKPQQLEHAMEEMNFSARAHDRILKVARIVAYLAGVENIRADYLLESIQYRSLDRKLFS